jgi:cytochrome c oxidase subunit I
MSDVILAAPAAHAIAEPQGIGRWLTTTDHKRIGQLYIGASLVFFLVAVGFAMLMRMQLSRPNMKFLTPEEYNQIFSMHGTTMIFLFAMPMLIGLANYLVPLMIGARDMAFPRMNALSFWAFLLGGILLYSSFAFGGALDTGWFSYAPLTSKVYSPHDGVTFWTIAIALLGVSSILGAINFIITMLKLRAPGMTFWRMPLFAMATFLNSFLILFAFPSLTAAVAMLYLDRQWGTTFFEPAGGGDPIVWQHLFWFFGHPEVYILILPAFGIMSEVVPVFSRKPLFGRSTMIIMLGVIGLMGFLVWGHHMYAVGLPSFFNIIMAGTSMLIAIPTGVKIFNWLATMWGGSLKFNTPLLFCCGFIALFTIGGISGVTLAVVPWDWQVEDTYYVVAHLHNVLFPGTLFAVFAGIYYWFPKVTGRMMSDRLGKVHFWLILVGFVVTFLPMYVLGVLGMPRRVYTYNASFGWDTFNLISAIGGFIIAAAVIVFFVNIIRSARKGEMASDNPWRAWTLEWATTSPPPPGNFVTLPPVHSERPLWDLERAATASAASAGTAPAVSANAAVTGAPAVPGPSSGTGVVLGPWLEQSTPLPLFAGLALLVVAVGLLTSLIVSALGIVFLLVMMGVWMSARWVAPEYPPVPGERFSLIASAALAFIGSEAVFFAALIGADIHLHLHAGDLSAGVHLHAALPAVNTVVLVTSGVMAHYAQVNYRKQRPRAFAAFLVLTVVLGAAFLGGQAWEYSHNGFGLTSGLLGSTFYTLTGFHGLHVVAGILVLVFLFARVRQDKARGVAHGSSATAGMVDAATYYWHFVDAVWVVLFVVVYLL